MRILVTAGSTNVMIDKVRCISNIFKGRTGHDIAAQFYNSGHSVDLLTSNPDLFKSAYEYESNFINIHKYATYDILLDKMLDLIAVYDYDVIIHSSAVSDYEVEGTYYMGCLDKLCKIDASTKISSSHKEFYLKLTPTQKIVNLIKKDWGFKGQLVKFKLQVGISDEQLIDIAKKSMVESGADYIVANTLGDMTNYAWIIKADGAMAKVSRKQIGLSLVSLTENYKSTTRD